MVIVMTEDNVKVYDISDEEFEKLRNNNNQKELDKHVIYQLSKLAYSPEKMQQQLKDKLLGIKSYYFDDSTLGLVKKQISTINQIRYPDVLSDPLNGFNVPKSNDIVINPMYAELIALDNELNASEHITNLLPPHLINEFKKFYSQEQYLNAKKNRVVHIDKPYVLNSFYEFESFSKLIIKNSNNSLKTSQLEGAIHLVVAPAGMTEDGKVKYFVEEYKITKEDLQDISSRVRKYARQDGIKLTDLTDDEKYSYYDRAVREYKQNLFGELTGLNNKKKTIIQSKTVTWLEYKKEFLNKYGYPVPEFDATWLPFDKTIIDARTIHNGNIVLITIEAYQREASKETQIKIPNFVNRMQTTRRFFFDENSGLSPLSVDEDASTLTPLNVVPLNEDGQNQNFFAGDEDVPAAPVFPPEDTDDLFGSVEGEEISDHGLEDAPSQSSFADDDEDVPVIPAFQTEDIDDLFDSVEGEEISDNELKDEPSQSSLADDEKDAPEIPTTQTEDLYAFVDNTGLLTPKEVNDLIHNYISDYNEIVDSIKKCNFVLSAAKNKLPKQIKNNDLIAIAKTIEEIETSVRQANNLIETELHKLLLEIIKPKDSKFNIPDSVQFEYLSEYFRNSINKTYNKIVAVYSRLSVLCDELGLKDALDDTDSNVDEKILETPEYTVSLPKI